MQPVEQVNAALYLTTGNHRTTEPDSGPIACSSASGIKAKLLHWPTASADWHKSGPLYRTTANSCKSGNLFLAQRLHTQAQTVPVNLGYLPRTGRAHASHHLWGHLHSLQKLSTFAPTLALSLLCCLLYHLLHYFRICKEAAAMAGSVRTSVGQKYRTLHAFTQYVSVMVKRLCLHSLVQISLPVLSFFKCCLMHLHN